MVDANSRVFVIIGIIAIVVILIAVFAIAFYSKKSGSDDDGCQSLGPPIAIKVNPLNLTQIRITFTPNAQATVYRVYVGNVSGFDKSNAFIKQLGNTSPITISELVSNRDYYIRVASLDSCLIEGPLSSEITVSVGFPKFFKIVNKANPDLLLGITAGVSAQPVTSEDCGNEDCVWTYNSATQHIKPYIFSDSTCLGSIENGLYDIANINLCGAFAIDRRSWFYEEAYGTLCHSNVTLRGSCIKINGPLASGNSVTINPFAELDTMKWDLVGVPDPAL